MFCVFNQVASYKEMESAYTELITNFANKPNADKNLLSDRYERIAKIL